MYTTHQQCVHILLTCWKHQEENTQCLRIQWRRFYYVGRTCFTLTEILWYESHWFRVYMLHVLSHGLSLNCSSSSVEVEPVSHRFLKSPLSDQKSHCHLLKNKKKRMSNWYLLLKRKCKTKNEERDKIDKNRFIPEYACQNPYSWIAHYIHTSSV